MSIVLMTGDHLRHRYIADSLYQHGLLAGLVVEKRERFVPTPPDDLAEVLKLLFLRHFQRRDKAERRHFGHTSGFPSVPVLEVTHDELNGNTVRQFLTGIKHEFLISYGVHILSQQTLDSSNAHYQWNLHGGLSPWYRGCVTHFWPSYFLEPQMTGFTIHELTNELDHGPVIHQTGTDLVRGDGLHDLACRAVIRLVEELTPVIDYASQNEVTGRAHSSSGRLWLSRDWRPEHLQLIYEYYDDAIVDSCLDGKITGRVPELIKLMEAAG